MMSVCLTPQGCLSSATDSIWASFAGAVKDAAGQMVTTMFGWWTTTPPLNVNTVLVHTAQNYVTAWIAVPVAVLAILAAVGWGVLGGGISWLSDVGRGLIIFGIVAAGSIPIVAALQNWSTELAKGLLNAVPTHDVGSRMIGLLDVGGPSSALLMMFWAGVMLIAASVQYLMMLFRDGAVLVLTAVLPLAAAGQFNRGSVFWLPKVTGWLLAFIFLKPAAALIYYLGLLLIGQSQGLHALVSGVCMMIAAILALPAMLRLVTFAVNAAPMGSGGGLSAATTASGFALAAAQMSSRSGPTAAAGAGATGAATSGAASSATATTATPAGAAIAASDAGQAAVADAVKLGKDSE